MINLIKINVMELDDNEYMGIIQLSNKIWPMVQKMVDMMGK